MDLDAVKRRVYAVLRDDGRTFVTDEDVEAWTNDAQRDLAHRQKVLTKSFTGTTSDGSIALPSDLIEIKSLRLGTDDILFTDDDTFWGFSDGGLAPSATLGRVFGGEIEIYPAPTTSTDYTVRYVYEPTDLVNENDPSDLPAELHVKLVYYAQAHAKYKEGEDTQGDRYMAMYEAGLNAPPLGKTRTNPGPLRMTPVAGPFETDDYLGSY